MKRMYKQPIVEASELQGSPVMQAASPGFSISGEQISGGENGTSPSAGL